MAAPANSPPGTHFYSFHSLFIHSIHLFIHSIHSIHSFSITGIKDWIIEHIEDVEAGVAETYANNLAARGYTKVSELKNITRDTLINAGLTNDRHIDTILANKGITSHTTHPTITHHNHMSHICPAISTPHNNHTPHNHPPITPLQSHAPTITSHHITSHHITSHHITSHHITSHHITSHHITSHHITSHHITSHHITSHHITSHHITSHHITHSHYTLPIHSPYSTSCNSPNNFFTATPGAPTAAVNQPYRISNSSPLPPLPVPPTYFYLYLSIMQRIASKRLWCQQLAGFMTKTTCCY
jgi:hypothetical protein